MTLSSCWHARNEALWKRSVSLPCSLRPILLSSWSQVVSGSLGARLLGSFNLERWPVTEAFLSSPSLARERGVSRLKIASGLFVLAIPRGMCDLNSPPGFEPEPLQWKH